MRWILITVLTAVWLPVVWVATHVASEDGYVDLTSEMIQDEQFRDRLTTTTADALVDGTSIPPAVGEVVRRGLSATADRLAASPEFVDAWARTQRQSHRALFESDRLVIDVAPLAQSLVDAATEQLPARVDVPGQLVVTVGSSDQKAVIDGIAATSGAALVGGLLLVACAAVAVVSSRRRLRSLAWLGAAVVAAAVLDRVLAHEVVPRVLAGDATTGSLAHRTQELLTDQVVASFDTTTLLAGGVGLALVIVGLLASSRPVSSA